MYSWLIPGYLYTQKFFAIFFKFFAKYLIYGSWLGGVCLWKCQKSPKNAHFSPLKVGGSETQNFGKKSFFWNISAPRPPTEMCEYSLDSLEPEEGDGAGKNIFFYIFTPKNDQKPKNGSFY